MSNTSRPSAKLTVTTGPDRGKILELIEELTSIGSGTDHHWILTDPLLAGREVQIVCRNGRHAIFAVGLDDVEVDGTRIPADRWVWLPESAMIKISQRTSIEFVSLLEAEEEFAEIESLPVSAGGAKGSSKGVAVRGVPMPAKSARNEAHGEEVDPDSPISGQAQAKLNRTRKPAVKKPEKSENVARFITDQHGDSLVKLGEDGHLPELQLQEGQSKSPRESRKKDTNPLLLVAAFCVSVGLSMLMLFADLDTTASSATQKATARKVMALYHGGAPPLEPYEIKLRQAQQAYSQGNYAVERQRYRDVMAMLRSERKHPVKGLTRLNRAAQDQLEKLSTSELQALGGNFWQLSNDEKLSRLIAILLSGN